MKINHRFQVQHLWKEKKERKTAGCEHQEFQLSRWENWGSAAASSLVIRYHWSPVLICYELETAGQESHWWYLLFSSHLFMFPDEDEGDRQWQKEAAWKYWDISRGQSIHFLQLPLIEVMDHLQVHPHLSLSDKGRPQSNIHTPRTRSYFSIPLHPWLLLPILHSHVLILSSSQVFSASHCHLHYISLFLCSLEPRVDIYSMPCNSCTSFLPSIEEPMNPQPIVYFLCVFMRVRVFAHPGWPIVPPPTQWMSLPPSCQHGRTRCQDWRADCALVALWCRGPLQYLPLFSESFPKNADRKISCCHIHSWYNKIREQGYKGQREIVF